MGKKYIFNKKKLEKLAENICPEVQKKVFDSFQENKFLFLKNLKKNFPKEFKSKKNTIEKIIFSTKEIFTKISILVILLTSLNSCYKTTIEPQPKMDCSDILIWKRHWVSTDGTIQYQMQWKKTDGTYYNMAWASLYWEKIVGDRLCSGK